MSANANIRIGLVGAGANTRLRHIPGFQAIDGVDVVAVANRSAASGQRVADEFGIPRVFDNWQDLVNSQDVDAVCIGTWPYMHCTVTLAALDAGKHVLTEARMAMDAAEAKAMLQASRSHPGLVTQVVPSPFTFKVDRTVQDLVASGYLGDLTAIEARVTQNSFPDFRGPSPLATGPGRQRVQHSDNGHLVRGPYAMGRASHRGLRNDASGRSPEAQR